MADACAAPILEAGPMRSWGQPIRPRVARVSRPRGRDTHLRHPVRHDTRPGAGERGNARTLTIEGVGVPRQAPLCYNGSGW